MQTKETCQISHSMANTFAEILREELVPAMGCTEPIALAYCSAKARDVLGHIPDRLHILVSGNILKNVKSVIVPNTNGLKGISAAAAAGIIAGQSDKILEVIADVSEEEKKNMVLYLEKTPITVAPLESEYLLDMIVEAYYQNDCAKVRIADYHTNIISIEKNEEVLFTAATSENKDTDLVANKGLLNIERIVAFADMADLDTLHDVLDLQISYNTAIAKEGLENNYGANIGSTLLKIYGNDIKVRAKALAAAGSDARMSGCELPVIINSGSGNQGMTASLPVIAFAEELGVSKDMLYRALIVSNLTAIHLKTGIGRLSAYCGAISAGCGAGAGVAYLHGGKFKEIAHTVVNALGIASGVVCDGAKSSCAAKIALAVDAGILGYFMYTEGKQFLGGDGLISKGVENTIRNINRLGKEGMRETDKEIIRIMCDY
ncbi:MAG TPA: L-serine ammonia-lyase, iron-sulfur-dependent, subunit alpha [Lachnospiraceae bacterium]